MKKTVYTLVALLLPLLTIQAQESFTTDLDRFHRDFGSSLRFTGEVREGGSSMRREFNDFWHSDTLSLDEKEKFINTANLMRGRGAKDYPDFVCLAANIMAYKRRGIDSETYNNYEKVIINNMEARRPNLRNFSDYMLNMNRLFDRDIVRQNPRTFWQANNNNFSIKEAGTDVRIEFNNIDLIAYDGNDSLVIYRTSGTYNPDRANWEGSGGTVTWERVGYSRDSVSASLRSYSIDMRNTNYTADSVSFINQYFVRTPMEGRFLDRTRNISDPSTSNYPRFISYQQHFRVRNIFEGIDYQGGLSIRGRNFIGSGTFENPAEITINKNDTVNLKAYSQRFVIDTDIISSETTEIALHLSDDSIYHPSINFRYNNNDRFLELIRTRDGMSRVHFFNSYHAINMDFTLFTWEIDRNLINMATVSTPGTPNEAMFESMDFYRVERYQEIQQRDAQHPLQVINNFLNFWGIGDFTIRDLAQFMGYSAAQVRNMVLNLAYRGFIHYNSETGAIRVYPKTNEFLMAHRGAKDSDVMQLYSKTRPDVPNAELSLLNYDLRINGVSNVHLSDSQNVMVYPIDQRVIMQQNRKFSFNGTIQAGQFYYYGSNFVFDYDNFMIELAHCDSMKMVAETPYRDQMGNLKLAIVRNQLENFSGNFYIDEPENKSGRNQFPEYPIFETHTEAYVYFQRPYIHNNVYDKNRFYYKVEPFRRDSIDGFSPDNINFSGTLHSAGIFPDITENIVLREDDFSLGFTTRTPAEGYPIYDGLATYHNIIDLSNFGLRGSGKLEYLTANFDADHLLFFPDSLQGKSQNSVISKQKSPVEFPEVKGTDNTLNWAVREDRFYITRTKDNFDMYEEQTDLDGVLNLTTKGLFGEGLMTFPNAQLESNQFEFSKNVIDSDTAGFNIFSETAMELDFVSDNVNANVCFVNRVGHFKSNGEATTWTFPRNQYMSEMDQLTWYMDEDEIAISAESEALAQLENIDARERPQDWEDLFLDGPRFTSIHPQQDSLSFVAPRARYNYREHIITAEGVEFLRVADATIFPGDKTLEIKRNAVMSPLVDSEIEANNITRYHNIFNATINVLGRRVYNGEGDYYYIDANKEKQKLHFSRISVDATGQTIANGDIIEPDDFTLSPNYQFIGKANLYANQEFLEFEGAAEIKHECEKLDKTWVAFTKTIEPESIFIPITEEQYDINNNKLSTGLALSPTGELYPTFLNRLRGEHDEELFTVDGYLHYDNEDGNFKVAEKDKMMETSLPGNYVEMHSFICNIYGEGRFNFSRAFGLFKPNAIGNFRYNPITDTVRFNLSMIMDAYFNTAATRKMAANLSEIEGLRGLDLRSRNYEKAIVEYLGTEDADEWLANLSIGSFGRLPRILQDKFVFTDLEFIWYNDNNSFIHEGPIGIANIGRDHVNRYVHGFIKIEKSRRGDVFEMLLEPDAETWYYFRYSAGIFSAISSNEEFNQDIYDTRPRQRELSIEDKPSYQYGLGSSSHKRRFQREMYLKFDIQTND